MGLGQSGISAARCLLNFRAKLFLSEIRHKKEVRKNLPVFARFLKSEFGTHSRKIIENELIIVSPGVPWNTDVLVQARKMKIPVWTELELAYRLGSFKKIAAVTGTNGKTTTVSLIGDMCVRNGLKMLVAGNIGKPLCDFVDSSNEFDVFVLEASSYQLEGVELFHSNVSVMLNLTPDHIHRHHTMRRYAHAKENIFINQTAEDSAVLNYEDAWCRKMGKKRSSDVVWFSSVRKLAYGVFFDKKNSHIIARFDNPYRYLTFPPPTHLFGLHNMENCCAAIASALKLGIAYSAIRDSLKFFKGVEHRLENVKTVRGVTYINDSKGTNVDSTLKALEAFDGPIWLILGGEDKGSSYRPLKPLIKKKVKGIFLIGEAAGKINSELKGACEFFRSRTLKAAVRQSIRRASPNDLVLLSPACASFDQFRNFEDRGNQFKQFVKELK